jgi:hypothetical protein
MNRTLTRALEGKTPYEALNSQKPNLRTLHEWGSRVWVRVEAGNKLGGRVRKGRWMGFDNRSKGFRVFWHESRTLTVE